MDVRKWMSGSSLQSPAYAGFFLFWFQALAFPAAFGVVELEKYGGCQHG